MQKLISETFSRAGLPENWQFARKSFHTFEKGGLKPGMVTALWIPLSGAGWNVLRVELEFEGIGGATIECGDGVTHAILRMSADADLRPHEIRKYRHRLAESSMGVAAKNGTRHLVVTFDHGHIRVAIDGQEFLSAIDPFPRPFGTWLYLGLWGDMLVKRLEVFGDDPCPAIKCLPERKTRDFFLEVNVDFIDDILRAPFSKHMFDDLFAEFASWGVKRCHWIYYGEKEDGLWDLVRNWAQTCENVGRIFSTAVEAAHRHGVEIYGMIKPFDMGFHPSFGEGTDEARTQGRVQRIGGPVGRIAKFPAEHPEYLVARKPGAYGAAVNERFTRIELVKEDDRPCAFSVDELSLYVSNDNATYHLYEGSIQRRETVEDYPVYQHTASGGRQTGQTRRCRVMRLEDLDLRAKYFAVSISGRTGSFVNNLLNLIHIFGDKGEERLMTLGIAPRAPSANRADFREIGMEFDHGAGTPTAVFAGFDAITEPFGLDAGAGVLAVARGKERSPLAHLSPAFRESRDWWLSWIRAVLEAGADGVELRVRNHHNDLAWGEYGFEAPVVAEFKKRYGVDLLATDDFDRVAFRRLRGEYYTQFYREARQLVDTYGKRLGLHISVTHDMEPEQGAAMEIHWDWRAWLTEGLADSVTMKEVRPGSRLAQEILSLTRPQGIPVIYCPFNSHWSGPDNLSRVEDRIRNAKAGGYDGFQFYECSAVVEAKADRQIVMTVPPLRELFREHFITQQGHDAHA